MAETEGKPNPEEEDDEDFRFEFEDDIEPVVGDEPEEET